jgi:hypothetical protein
LFVVGLFVVSFGGYYLGYFYLFVGVLGCFFGFFLWDYYFLGFMAVFFFSPTLGGPPRGLGGGGLRAGSHAGVGGAAIVMRCLWFLRQTCTSCMPLS